MHRNVLYNRVSKTGQVVNPKHTTILNYADFELGTVYALNVIHKANEVRKVNNKKKITVFPEVITAFDSAYYDDVIEFITGVFFVCDMMKIRLLAFSSGKLYAPQDLKKHGHRHYDDFFGGSWASYFAKIADGRIKIRHKTAGEGSTDYTHLIRPVNFEALRPTSVGRTNSKEIYLKRYDSLISKASGFNKHDEKSLIKIRDIIFKSSNESFEPCGNKQVAFNPQFH